MEHLLEQDFDPMATLSMGSGGALGPNEVGQFAQQPFLGPSLVSPKPLQEQSEIDVNILPLLLDGTQDGGSQSLSLRAEIGPDLPSNGRLSRTDSAAMASSLSATDNGNTIDRATLTVDNDPFQDLDPLGDIPIALSDCKRISSIPFSEIFDTKRELAILSPALTRASWSEDANDEDNIVSNSFNIPRTDWENTKAIRVDRNLVPNAPPPKLEKNQDLEYHLSSYGIQVMQDPYSVPVPSLLPLSTSTTERSFQPPRSRANSDTSATSTTSTSALKRSYGDRHRLLAEKQMISPNNPETKRLKPWSSSDAKVQTIAVQEKSLRTGNNHNTNANRFVQPSSTPLSSSSSSHLRQQDEKAKTKAPLVGEHRLKINFSSLGGIGEIPQHFGKKRCLIPDGLDGTHELYNQKWHFEVDHRKAEGDVIVIHWRITNLASGTVTERTETTHEAFIREYKGQTICNQILREALEIRARELEAALKEKSHQKSSNSIQTSLKAVRPRKCIMGLLFFGLLHQCVQENLKR